VSRYGGTFERNEEKIFITTKINKQLKNCINFKDVININ